MRTAVFRLRLTVSKLGTCSRKSRRVLVQKNVTACAAARLLAESSSPFSSCKAPPAASQISMSWLTCKAKCILHTHMRKSVLQLSAWQV